MEVKQIINSVFNSNTFIIYDGGKAVVIDIGDFKPVKKFIEENNLSVEGLFITHTHYDHIYGIRDFMEAYPHTPVYTSAFGKEALHKSNWNFSRYHDDEIIIESDMIKAVEDGGRIKIPGDTTMTVIATPGHDKSCISLLTDDMLFSGDSYIPGVKVVASFPNSNREDAATWYERLHDMAINRNLYPGHGECILSAPLSS